MTEPLRCRRCPPMPPVGRDPRRRRGVAPPAVALAQLFWRQFRKSPLALAGGAILLLVLLRGRAVRPFSLPTRRSEMDRARFFHPPHRVHWIDGGPLPLASVRPPDQLVDPGASAYGEDTARLPLRFFVAGRAVPAVRLIPTDRHLFGVDAARPRLPARHRPVRPRRVLAAALRGAGLAHGRPRRASPSRSRRAAARRPLRLLRRLGRHVHHAVTELLLVDPRRSI